MKNEQAKPTGPWEVRPVREVEGEYFTVSRVVGRRRVHLKYASDGKPMWYGKEQADAAVAAAVCDGC